jgi:hypothetical protein
MTFAEFERSLKSATPLHGLAPALAALWWARKDDWEQAHTIVMNEDSRDAAWVHAHLHRIEGDAGNGPTGIGRPSSRSPRASSRPNGRRSRRRCSEDAETPSAGRLPRRARYSISCDT